MESLKKALILDSHTSGSELVPVQQMSLRKALILDNHRFNKSLTQKQSHPLNKLGLYVRKTVNGVRTVTPPLDKYMFLLTESF